MAQEAARAYWRFTVLWLIIGSALGILAALALLAPQLFSARPTLGFGRLVAAHRATMIHGVFFAAVFASAYTLLPRLTQAHLYSSRASLGLGWIGAAIVLAGVLSILAGHGSGREYADLPDTLAFIFWLYLILVAVDLSVLLTRTRSLAPSPATGLLLLAAIIPAVVYPFALPEWWGGGIFDAVRTWVGWRTIFIGSFTAAALGIGIWHLGSRGFDHKLQRGAFVAGIVLVMGLGPMMGVVHLLDSPVWSGLKAIGALAGVLVGAGLLILVRTMWSGRIANPPGLLYLAGLVGIAAVAVQGVAMVIPPIHTAFHFTSNTSAHAHLALGSILLILLAGALLAAPRLSRRPLANAARSLTGIGWLIGGLVTLFLAQTSAGAVQAAAFSRNLSTSDWLPAFRWLQAGVAVGGVAVFVGILILGWVILGTINAPVPEPVVQREETFREEELVEGGEG